MKALRTFALAVLLLAIYPATGLATPPDDPLDRMADAINDIRADHGLAPLRQSPTLRHSAAAYARVVIRHDSLNHGSSYRKNGFRRTAEIMSYNHGWSTRPRAPIQTWLGSSGHRALLLSPSFRYLGAGIARGRFGGAPAAIWIVHFGAR